MARARSLRCCREIVANVYLKRPVLESFLFSLALAVGLTPQLLPAIVSVNLARGAKQMAKKQVIVKRLAAIRQHQAFDISSYQKLDEVPYDFNRKRLSILFTNENTQLIITKGALISILDVCATVETAPGQIVDITGERQQLQQQAEDFGSKGSGRHCIDAKRFERVD